MAEPFHVYRLSDCAERIYRSAEPLLVVPCNNDCQPGTDLCAHRCMFQPLVDLPLPIIAIHERDLPQVLALYRGANWGHALLFHRGRVVQHWTHIPTRPELDGALARLEQSQVIPEGDR